MNVASARSYRVYDSCRRRGTTWPWYGRCVEARQSGAGLWIMQWSDLSRRSAWMRTSHCKAYESQTEVCSKLARCAHVCLITPYRRPNPARERGDWWITLGCGHVRFWNWKSHLERFHYRANLLIRLSHRLRHSSDNCYYLWPTSLAVVYHFLKTTAQTRASICPTTRSNFVNQSDSFRLDDISCYRRYLGGDNRHMFRS